MRIILFSALLVGVAAAADGSVVTSSPTGFHVSHTQSMVATPEEAWTLVGQPSQWWSGEHSYSGDAANFRMELRPGGCFCEMMPDGGFVEHMRVISVIPGQEIMLEGPLGPLRTIPASGIMTIKLEGVGQNTRVRFDFKASGFPQGDGATWATAVDGVIGEQAKRLRARAASRGQVGIPEN